MIFDTGLLVVPKPMTWQPCSFFRGQESLGFKSKIQFLKDKVVWDIKLTTVSLFGVRDIPLGLLTLKGRLLL